MSATYDFDFIALPVGSDSNDHQFGGGDAMRRLRRDEGVVLVLVAGLLVVLLGMAGLAVDLGACTPSAANSATGPTPPPSPSPRTAAGTPGPANQSATATAQMYADANSDDGASGVQVASLRTDGSVRGRDLGLRRQGRRRPGCGSRS